METMTAQAYKEALPKPKKVDIWEKVSRLAALTGITGTGLGLLFAPKTYNEYLFSIFTLIIILGLIIHIYSYERKKLHRYADSVLFAHYVNHIVRDAIEYQRLNFSSAVSVKSINQDILDAISRCFSILTGKNCRCCIKELNESQELITVARDTVSGYVHKNRKEERHYLNDNTDFKSLWYGEDGCARYFICNNLPELYRDGKYENSSFKEVGFPETEKLFFGAKRVTNWNLPYKSTIVLPIRYLSDIDISPGTDGVTEFQKYWGFLCIDCNKKDVFNEAMDPELAGAFADTLYTLYSQLSYMSTSFQELEKATKPT